MVLVFSQLYYTISSEGLFVFHNRKMPYSCGLWRFAKRLKNREMYERRLCYVRE